MTLSSPGYNDPYWLLLYLIYHTITDMPGLYMMLSSPAVSRCSLGTEPIFVIEPSAIGANLTSCTAILAVDSLRQHRSWQCVTAPSEKLSSGAGSKGCKACLYK